MQRILQEIIKKNNTWNIRCLVDDSFVSATLRIILKNVGFQIEGLFPRYLEFRENYEVERIGNDQ